MAFHMTRTMRWMGSSLGSVRLRFMPIARHPERELSSVLCWDASRRASKFFYVFVFFLLSKIGISTGVEFMHHTGNPPQEGFENSSIPRVYFFVLFCEFITYYRLSSNTERTTELKSLSDSKSISFLLHLFLLFLEAAKHYGSGRRVRK
jgi:hypothetical protein